MMLIVDGKNVLRSATLLRKRELNGRPTRPARSGVLGHRRRSASTVADRLGARALLFDGRLLDVIQLRKFLVQIGVPVRLNRALVRLLTVLTRDLLHHVHA